LGIFSREQPNPLAGLTIALGMERYAPGILEGIAVLDLDPGVEERTAYADGDDDRDERRCWRAT